MSLRHTPAGQFQSRVVSSSCISLCSLSHISVGEDEGVGDRYILSNRRALFQALAQTPETFHDAIRDQALALGRLDTV